METLLDPNELENDLFSDDEDSPNLNDEPSSLEILLDSDEGQQDAVNNNAPSASEQFFEKYSMDEIHPDTNMQTNFISKKEFDIGLVYESMLNIGNTFTSQLTQEFRNEGSHDTQKPCTTLSENQYESPTAFLIDKTIAKHTYCFDKPIDCQNLEYSMNFEHITNTSVDPLGIRKIAAYNQAFENDFSRAYIFTHDPDTIYMLPGHPTFKLVPGLDYEFLSSKKVTKGGMDANRRCTLPYDNNIANTIPVRFIVKKSLRWKPKKLTTTATLEIFRYLKDLCLLKKVEALVDKKDFSGHMLTSDDFEQYSRKVIATLGIGEVHILSKILIVEEVLQECLLEETNSGHESVWSRERILGLFDNGSLPATSVYTTRRHGQARGLGSYGEQDEELLSVGLRKGATVGFYNPKKKVSDSGFPFDHTTGTGVLFHKVFSHDHLKSLYPYYSKSELLRIPFSGMCALSEIINSSPATLCFFYSYADYLRDSKRIKTAHLKELTLGQLKSLYLKQKKPDDVAMRAVMIYQRIKREVGLGGHKYVEQKELYAQTSIGQEQKFTEALSFLLDQKAIISYKKPDPIDLEQIENDCKLFAEKYKENVHLKGVNVNEIEYPLSDFEKLVKKYTSQTYQSQTKASVDTKLITLPHIHHVEQTIAASLEKIFENYRKNPVKPFCKKTAQLNGTPLLRPVRWSSADVINPPTHQECSEQLRLRRNTVETKEIPTSPLCIIQGKGGAGKTEGLYKLVEQMKPNSFLVLTAQGANAAGCSEKVYKHSHTIHSILRSHLEICPRSPWFSRKAVRGMKKYSHPIEKMPTGEERTRAFMQLSAQEKLDLRNPMECKGIRFCARKKNHLTEKYFDVCFLSQIKHIIIDEISLVDDELMAALLKAVTTCGNPTSLYVCGDFRQKRQIGCGCLHNDLRFAFPWCITPFSHCHRFANGKLSTNADYIYEGKPEKIDYDPKCFALIDLSTCDYYSLRKTEEKKTFLGQLFNHYNIGLSPFSIVLTRSNENRYLISNILRQQAYGDTRSFNINQKIYSEINDPIGLVRKQILVIIAIQYVPLGSLKGKKSKATREQLAAIRETPLLHVSSTKEKPNVDHKTTFRRLVAVPLSVYKRGPNEYNKPGKQILIPYFGSHMDIIYDASVVTFHYMQGSETDEVCIFYDKYWEISDSREEMFTNCTRGAKKIIVVSTEDTMAKCIRNQHPPRRSVATEYLKQILLRHLVWLYKRHTQRRHKLEAAGFLPGDYFYEEFANKFQLVSFPPPADLFSPPFPEILELEKQEGDKFDAHAMVEAEETKKIEDELKELKKIREAKKLRKRKRREERESLKKQKTTEEK